MSGRSSIVIEKAYLMITTGCNLACRYCIVDKTDEHMPPEVMRQAVDLVLGTAGKTKKIAIYGGEPLTRFDLVQQAVGEVESRPLENDRRVELYLYTNGTLLDEPILTWLAEHRVRLVYSLDAGPLSGPGSVPAGGVGPRLANAARALAALGERNVCGASVVLPAEAGSTAAQFRWLVERAGFRTIKLLPGLVRYTWSDQQLSLFETGLDEILHLILHSVGSGRMVFLDSLNESLRRVATRYDEGALNLSVVEIYPDGSFGLSPCEFQGREGTGTVNDFQAALLGRIDEIDAAELERRVRSLDLPRHRGLALLSRWSERTALRLAGLAERSPGLGRYLTEARERSFA